MENLLRYLVKFFAGIYFDFKKPSQRKDGYIAVTGKVLDKKELNNMIDATLDMWLTTGRFNDKFEAKMASFLGVKHFLTTNSGSSANLLALTALTSHKLGNRRIKKGDEVITVSAAFPTTISPIVQCGLVPVFADVNVGTYNIEAEQIEECITPKTKAIFLAHILGNPINLGVIQKICQKHNLWLIEDNCDGLGAQYDGKYTGTYGHISTFSFYPAHHITMGEGGALATNDTQLFRIILSFRDWGRDCWCPPGKDNTCKNRFNMQLGNLPFGYDHKYTYSHLGFNLKITDWQAACGLAQTDKLLGFIAAREKNFNNLFLGLKQFEKYFILPSWEAGAKPCWFGFPLTVKADAGFDKITLCKFLESKGIGTRQLFTGNILRQPAFTDDDISFRIRNSELLSSRDLGPQHYAMLPNTDTVMNYTFWIGVWPGITQEGIERIIAAFGEFVNTHKK